MGLLQDKSREVDEFVTRVLTTQLFATSEDSLEQDFAAQNIQMVAIPSHQHYQKFCTGLFGVPSEFASLDTKVHLKDLYEASGFADGIDHWVEGLGEKRTEGSNLGLTFACDLC